MYRVLLVEDEEIELETLRDYIDWKKNGISRVFTARNGRRALECLEENMADIVITDIQMNWQRRSYAGDIHAKLFF